MFKKFEEENLNLPQFVADSFTAMPPISGYELLAPMIVSLIDEISNLKEEMKIQKNSNIRDNILLDDTSHIKLDILDIKENVRDLKMKIYDREIRKLSTVEQNIKIPHENEMHHVTEVSDLSHCNFTPSAPPLSQVPIVQIDMHKETRRDKTRRTSEASDYSSPSLIGLENDVSSKNEPHVLTRKNDYSLKNSSKLSSFNKNTSYSSILKAPNNEKEGFIEPTRSKIRRNTLEGVHPSIGENIEDNDGFVLVNRRRRGRIEKNGIVGTKEDKNMNFTSAEKFYDLYIGNCSVNLTSENVVSFIKDEFNITVKHCEDLKTIKQYCKSFKVTMSLNQRESLLESHLWPRGIVVRKFFKSFRS